jgi:hypothetical protein
MLYIIDIITCSLLKWRAPSLPGANIYVKDGVAFVMGTITGFLRLSGIGLSVKLLIRSFKASTNLLCYGLKFCMPFRILLAVNPLAFLLQHRDATSDEMDCAFALVSFISKGFKNGLSEADLILLMKQSFDYDVTHEGIVYIANLGIQFNMIHVADVPLQLLPSLNAAQDPNDVVAVSNSVGQFIADHAIMFVIGFTLTCVAIIVYIYRSRAKPPSESIKDGGTKPETGEQPISNITNTSTSMVKYIVTLYASWLLFIRSFFINEKPWLIPLMVVIFHLNVYLEIFPFFDMVRIAQFFLWLGIYCIAIDNLGSIISTYALSGTSNLFDNVIPFLTKERGNFVESFYKNSGYAALIMGKTAMTATGRASLIIGVLSGAGYLLNAQLDRNHQAAQNTQNHDRQDKRDQRQRDFTSREAQRQRDWQDRKDKQKAYESSWNPFKRPPKP